jgi:diguanylate cyclase (GGDEF)-like protein
VWGDRERIVAAELAASAGAEAELHRVLAAQAAGEEQLRHGMLHDALTGLANRALFMDRLAQAMRRARRHEQARFCVLFLDLDRFKVVNDSLGHESGDQLLLTVSRRLQGCVRSEDTVARLGGDEFAVLVEHIEDEHDAVRVAERIHLSLAAPVNLGGYDVFTSASIGIVSSAVELEEPEYVIRGADMAMYRAKSAGRSRYEMFDRAMHARALARLQTETDLRHAIERDEFVLHYQPIISLATGQVSGFEALVRWQHPERGLVPPMEFIPLAEEMGLIVPIGKGVLHEACRQLKEWQRRFPRESTLSMAVNLSPKQFSQPNLVAHVADALSQYGLQPRCLRLEITESMIVENAAYTAAMLGQLQGLGVQVYLDDFGTGYSSLSYLHRLPFDAIKIDREFVEEMTRSAKAFQLVDVVRTLAQNIGGIVIAEGVETTEQLIALRDLGCEHAQGYYFSKPLDAAGVEALLGEDPRW